MERDEVDEDDDSFQPAADDQALNQQQADGGRCSSQLQKGEAPGGGAGGGEDSVHPLHSHILLYSSIVDSRSLLHFLTVSCFFPVSNFGEV